MFGGIPAHESSGFVTELALQMVNGVHMPNETIVHAGSSNSQMWLLHKGVVTIRKSGGASKMARFLTAGAVFGEVRVMSEGLASPTLGGVVAKARGVWGGTGWGRGRHTVRWCAG